MLFHPELQREFNRCCQMKLIVLLRDPAERALSQYFHSRHLGLDHLDLEEAFAAEASRFVIVLRR